MRKSLTIAAVCIFFFSCTKDKWFDQKQTLTQVVPSRVSDFQAMMDNTIMDYNAPYLGEVGCDDHSVPDAQFALISINEQNAYTWSHNQPYKSVDDWGIGNDGTYTRVYYCNLALDGLQKAAGAGTSDYNNVEGQALYFRAQNFYGILQEYAPAYDSATAATDLGICLRLQSDITIPSVRSNVKDSYNQVIADLNTAIPLLPVTPLYKTRPSRSACYALLARLYTSVGDYTDAGKYADSCLKLYTALVDFNTLNVTLAAPLVNYNDDVILESTLYIGNGPNTYNAVIDTALYNSYDSNDLRKAVFFKLNPNGTATFKCNNFGTAPFSGMSPEEMYIVRAESEARQGMVSAAMADLNTLLVKRYKTGTYVNKTAVSADEALRIVLAERRKELVLSGLRWSDLRRLNKDPRFAKTLTRTVKGTVYTLPPGDLRYTLPIPDDIISQNPAILQNKGY